MPAQHSKGTIMAFGAHQDDIELRAGGTVAKYISMGYMVIYVTAIDSVYVNETYKPDGKSFAELSHEDILNIRNGEARKGAAILGASAPVFIHLKPSYYWTVKNRTGWRVHFHNDDDLIENMKKFKGKYFSLEAAHTPECVNETAAFIKKHNPIAVLTQQPNDFHLEHYAVSSLAFAACRKLAGEGMNLKLYAWEMGSCGRMIKFVPDVIIDITDVFSIKIESLKPFVSQVVAGDPEIHRKYAKASAEYWGSKIGVKYAEPFSEMLIGGRTGGFYLNGHDFDYCSGFSGIDRIKTQL